MGFVAVRLTCFACSLAWGAALFSLTAPASAEPERSYVDAGQYPLLLVSSINLGPSGMEGRWGLSFERLPGRPARGGSWTGPGVGYGGAAGFSSFSPSDPASSEPSIRAAFVQPSIRPGFYFSARREMFVSGYVGASLSTIVDVMETGDARFTLSAQPGFCLNVERFTFGLAAVLNGTVLSSDGATGFGPGAHVAIGGMI